MTEKIPPYEVDGGVVPGSLEALKNRPCVLPYSHENYRPPTPIEVKALVKLAGWSQNDAAKLVGVSYNPKKGSTTIRKWQAKVDSPEYREISYAAWRHLLACAGVVTIEEDVAALEL